MRQQEELQRQQEELDAQSLESLRTSRAVFVSPAALSLGDVVAHGEGEFDVDPLPALPNLSDADVSRRHVRSAGEGEARGGHSDDGGAGSAGDGKRPGDGGVDSGASDQTGGGGGRRLFSIPPPVPLVGVAAPRGRPLIGLPGSKSSVPAQNTPLGHPMGIPVRNVSHGKIAVCHRSLKVRMRLAAHDEGLRRVAPECVTTMAHAVCAYVQRVARAAVAARDARIAERRGTAAAARGGSGRGLVGRGGAGADEPGTGGDGDGGSDCDLATLEARMLGTEGPGGSGDVFAEPTVRIEDLLAAMRGDPDPAAAAHLERVGLSLAEENAREVALGGFGFGGAFD